jgi:translation elongation factor EF-Tu-like GTPase
MSNTDLITIKAKLRLRTTEEGGRYSGIKTGYRPNHVFEYNKKGNFITTYIGEITFDKEWIQLGDEETVTVRFIPGQSVDKYLNVGQKWWIHEGHKLVGEAEILEV